MSKTFPTDPKIEYNLGRLRKYSRSRASAFERLVADLVPKKSKALLEKTNESYKTIRTSFPDLDPVQESIDWEAYRGRLYSYISSTIQDILEPIGESLEQPIARRGFENFWTKSHESFLEAISTMPADYVRQLPKEVYDSTSNDSSWLKIKKYSKRFGHSISRLFSGGETDQQIPLRNLSSYHFDNRVSQAECSFIKSRYKALSEIYRPLETALGSWNRSILNFDVAIDDILSSYDGGSSIDSSDVFEKHAAVSKNIERFGNALDKATQQIQNHQFEFPSYDDLFTELEEDIFQADTFLASTRVVSRESTNSHAEKISEIRSWQSWLEELSNYYRLSSIITRLRTSSTTNLDNFTKDFLQSVRIDVLEEIDRVKESNDALQIDLQSFVGKTTSAISFRKTVEKWLNERTELLEYYSPSNDETEQDHSNDSSIDVSSTQHLDQWKNNVQSLPESVRLHRSPVHPEIKPGTAVYSAKIRRWVEQSFDSVVLDRFRSAPNQTQNISDLARAGCKSAHEIVNFGIAAASEEFEESFAQADNTKKKTSEAIETAFEIISDALQRSDALLEERKVSLIDTGPEMKLVLRELKALGWKKLLIRFGGERNVDAQIAGMKDRTSYQAEKLLSTFKENTKDARLWLLWLRRKGIRKAWSVIRYGKGAFGMDEDEDEDILYSPDFYTTTEKIVGRLPLVYRHLFSLKPVDDAAILDGRESDINKLTKHLDIWRNGVSNAILLVGSHGSGMTSYLNVVQDLVFNDCKLYRIEIQERIDNEEDFCKLISKALGMDSSSTLNELRDKMLAHGTAEKLERVCILENLEHLFLRTPSGMSLIEDVLVFFSQTDDRILWVGTIGQQSWQLVDKLSSKVGDLLVSHNMENVTRDNLERAIMNRHGRSGLPIEFVRPNTLNPLVRRRLISANSQDEKQKVLRDLFFDNLHKEAEENFTLAIVYWLNSLRMDQDSQFIKVLPLKKLNFSFLDSFDADRAFSLKAFLEHASLTVAEHSKIFGVRPERSRVIFESFANLNLIEHFGIELGTLEVSNGSVDVDLRYRIRPLLVHPVNKFLRNRNIIH